MTESVVPGVDAGVVGDFRGARWLPGGHLQTVVPAILGAPAEPESRLVVVEVDAGGEGRGASSVEVWISLTAPTRQSVGARVSDESPVPALRSLEMPVPALRSRGMPVPARGTVLVVHGLGGSARSRDAVRTAEQALARGWNVARVNLRNCGGTEALASTLYNAGQSDDIGHVLAALERERLARPFGVISFSLGANQTLLHAAEVGADCSADAMVAINPPVDLGAVGRAIRRPENVGYQLKYTRSLCQLLDRIRAHREVPGPTVSWWKLRSVRRFDELYTVPDAGHPDVDTYYAAASSGPRLGAITLPTLVLSAANDPIVQVEAFEEYRTPSGHAVQFEHPASGGHCGYWQRGQPRAWAPGRALDFLEEVVGVAGL